MLSCAKVHIIGHPAHLVMHQGVVGKLEPASQTEAQARGGGPSTPGATQAITSLARPANTAGVWYCDMIYNNMVWFSTVRRGNIRCGMFC